MTDRKLASIQKIKSLTPIEGADRIEVAQFYNNAWQVVVEKGKFWVDDLAVFFEIDSMLDSDNPDFAFMEKSKWRVRTIKLKGQISQGLAMPIDILLHIPNEPAKFIEPAGYKYLVFDDTPDVIIPVWEGYDYTETLKITKYEAPIPDNLRGKVKGSFPGFLIKTDEERIQNIPEILTQYPDNKWDVTEKLDGTSFTCYVYNDVFGVCSRNMELIETEDNVYWQIARKYDLESKLRALGNNVCVQGEIVGQGIQGNKYNLSDKQLFVFNIYWIDSDTYCSHQALKERCEELELQMVPEIYFKTVIYTDVNAILEVADGPSVLNPNTKREGLVWRTNILENSKMRKISFKTISNQFLLKHGE